MARARIRREAERKPIDKLHVRFRIAEGEMATVLGIWEVKAKDKVGIPVDFLKQWIGEERLPYGWMEA